MQIKRKCGHPLATALEYLAVMKMPALFKLKTSYIERDRVGKAGKYLNFALTCKAVLSAQGDNLRNSPN